MDYYDSGQFGDVYCQYCGELLLKSEGDSIKKGRLSHCCANGAANTEEMKREFDELQNPPKDFRSGLAESKDSVIREEFLKNTMPLNNSFAFASVHGESAPEDQLGGRKDTCKYNGIFYHFLHIIELAIK